MPSGSQTVVKASHSELSSRRPPSLTPALKPSSKLWTCARPSSSVNRWSVWRNLSTQIPVHQPPSLLRKELTPCTPSPNTMHFGADCLSSCLSTGARLPDALRLSSSSAVGGKTTTQRTSRLASAESDSMLCVGGVWRALGRGGASEPRGLRPSPRPGNRRSSVAGDKTCECGLQLEACKWQLSATTATFRLEALRRHSSRTSHNWTCPFKLGDSALAQGWNTPAGPLACYRLASY